VGHAHLAPDVIVRSKVMVEARVPDRMAGDDGLFDVERGLS